MKRLALTTVVVALTLPAAGALAGSKASDGAPVIHWNQTLLSIVSTPGAQPANIQPTRSFAILHAAIYDAVNAIDRTHEPYLISVRAPRTASETAAADAAAHTALVGLYPAQQTALDADYATELATVPDGPAKDQGVRLGETSRTTCSQSAPTTARTPLRRRSSRGRTPATTSRRRRTSRHRCSRPGGR
jgi:hypothetical protein